MMLPRPRKPHKIWLRSSREEWKSTKPLKDRDKPLPSRPIKLTSSTLKNTMLTSKPLLLEKSLMLILLGKLNTTDKRDSHSIPQERPGPLTCQTMLLRTQISMLKLQLQLRKFWEMPPRLRPRPRLMPTQRRRPPQLPPHHSFNFTEAETLPKRELPTNLNPNHLDLNHLVLPAAHHPLTPNDLKIVEEKIVVF